MDVTLFIALLTAFSAITSLCTEGFKKLLDGIGIYYSSNVLAFLVACIVGAGGTGVYYILNSIEFTMANIVFMVLMVLMGLATSMTAMVGYDKVVQTITQIKN